MRVTLRRDGLRRFTIRLPFHISQEEIINAVAWRCVPAEEPVPTTRAVMLKILREEVREYGLAIVWRLEKLDAKEYAAKIAEVKAAVIKLFPELTGANNT